MVGPEFANSILKISRAEEHLKVYLDGMNTWKNSDPYVISKEVNGQRHSVTISIRNPPPLDHWSLIAGDCFHNLRSALDHAVYAVAIRDSGANPPPKWGDLQFPLVAKQEKWSAARDRRLGALSASSQAKIERLQPYNRVHKSLPPLLALLTHFDNADKHRLLTIASWHTRGGNIRIQADGPTTAVRILKTPINSQTKSIFEFDSNDPNVSYDYDPSFDITISHPQGPNGEHVSVLEYVIKILIAEVQSVVNLIAL